MAMFWGTNHSRKCVPDKLSAKYKIVGFLGQASVGAVNSCPVHFPSVRNMGGSKALRLGRMLYQHEGVVWPVTVKAYVPG